MDESHLHNKAWLKILYIDRIKTVFIQHLGLFCEMYADAVGQSGWSKGA